MASLSIVDRVDHWFGRVAQRLDPYLQRTEIVTALVVLLWACAVLPNLSVRSLIYEEGNNVAVAQDVLAHGHFLEPYVYGVRWFEKPSLLGWLIAGFAFLTGGVNEWSARLPAMLSELITALLVLTVTRRYASPAAALFAALSFLFCPLLLQKLTVAEPDTIITVLSFAALVVWWNGIEAGGVSFARWAGCGILLSALAMAKGPLPLGFFALGVAAYSLVERRWRDIPGFILCMLIPAAATIAWYAAVYQPGNESIWLSYARLNGQAFSHYPWKNIHDVGSLFLELLPASLLLPFVPWPWQGWPWKGWSSRKQKPDVPAIVAPLLLYSGLCTVALFLWPGVNTRYAMPIAPSVAVLGGIAWEGLAKSWFLPVRRVATIAACGLAAYQIVLAIVIVPLLADRFGETRRAGQTLEKAILADPAPAYCLRPEANVFFYMHQPLRCLDMPALAALTPPFWLLLPDPDVGDFAQRRPDLSLRTAVTGVSDARLTAARVEAR